MVACRAGPTRIWYSVYADRSRYKRAASHLWNRRRFRRLDQALIDFALGAHRGGPGGGGTPRTAASLLAWPATWRWSSPCILMTRHISMRRERRRWPMRSTRNSFRRIGSAASTAFTSASWKLVVMRVARLAM